MSASTVKAKQMIVHRRAMSAPDDIENEDPFPEVTLSTDKKDQTLSKEVFDETTLEEYNQLRPSYAGFDRSYHPPELTTDIVRNMMHEFSEMAEDDEEKIRTYLRIRPYTKQNSGEALTSNLYSVEGAKVLKIVGNPVIKRSNPYADETKFTFSRILGPECSQSTVFEECVQPIVESFFQGESCLIFSYGATNSGKTFTMQGYGTQFGIVPRTLDHIFNFLEDKLYTAGNIKPNLFNAFQSLSAIETKNLDDLKMKVLKDVKQQKSAEMNSFRASFRLSSSASTLSCNSAILVDKILNINSVPHPSVNHHYSSNVELYAVWVSFAEIYNERVYDLFETVQRGKRRKELKLLTDKEGRVYIKDLTELCANSAEEAYQLFLAGKSNLQFAVTQANTNSSRSHSFFNIRMVAVGMADKIIYPKKVFQMSFCDLAGIERVAQTGNVGLRLKESNNINQSLFVLLKCIRAMRMKQTRAKHAADVLPFRESKLARLFQGFLTTATHTCMIVNLNPEPNMFDASLHVLQNSAIASEVITYRRVEPPPTNDSKFGRRVRDSIGYSNKIRESFNNTSTMCDTLDEDDAEDDEDEFNCATVVAKSKMPTESIGAKLARLEIENANLKQENSAIEERVRREMLEQFAEIQRQYDEEQQQIARDREIAETHMNDRRMSFAVAVWNMNTTKEDKQVGTSPMQFDRSRAESLGTDSPYTATPPHKSKSLKKKLEKRIQEALDLQSEIEECKAELGALNANLEDRNREVARITTEKMEQEKLQERMNADLKHLLELKEEEIVNMKQNDPEKLKEESLNHIKKLSEELKLANEQVASLEYEVQEGVNQCVDYARRLEMANAEITQMSIDYNKLNQRTKELDEDCELMHFKVDDLEEQLAKEKKKCAMYESRLHKPSKTKRGTH